MNHTSFLCTSGSCKVQDQGCSRIWLLVRACPALPRQHHCVLHLPEGKNTVLRVGEEETRWEAFPGALLMAVMTLSGHLRLLAPCALGMKLPTHDWKGQNTQTVAPDTLEHCSALAHQSAKCVKQGMHQITQCSPFTRSTILQSSTFCRINTHSLYLSIKENKHFSLTSMMLLFLFVCFLLIQCCLCWRRSLGRKDI